MPRRAALVMLVALLTPAARPGVVLAQSPDAEPGGAAGAKVRSEVLSLLERLTDSACQFYRNGSWYKGSEAAAHLRRKFDYIARRRTLESTEAFIELGASASSFSGRAYQVRCAPAEPQASQAWLLEQLAQLRQTPPK